MKFEEFVDFGFKKVKKSAKAGMVGKVFSDVAKNYDLMNDLMSGGIHRIWKKKLIAKFKFEHGKTYRILDMAGGSGDIAFGLLKKAGEVGANVKITVADINQEMLDVGVKRAINKNIADQLEFKKEDGQKLTFADASFDYYVISFGIRNFTDINLGLSEANRVLKENGQFYCLEFSKVQSLIMDEIYDRFLMKVIPKIGKVVAKNEEAYEYLAQSIKKFPNQKKFAYMIKDVGFGDVEYQNLTNGVAAIHSGLKAG